MKDGKKVTLIPLSPHQTYEDQLRIKRAFEEENKSEKDKERKKKRDIENREEKNKRIKKKESTTQKERKVSLYTKERDMS